MHYVLALLMWCILLMVFTECMPQLLCLQSYQRNLDELVVFLCVVLCVIVVVCVAEPVGPEFKPNSSNFPFIFIFLFLFFPTSPPKL